jgi:hypothetical protein
MGGRGSEIVLAEAHEPQVQQGVEVSRLKSKHLFVGARGVVEAAGLREQNALVVAQRGLIGLKFSGGLERARGFDAAIRLP